MVLAELQLEISERAVLICTQQGQTSLPPLHQFLERLKTEASGIMFAIHKREGFGLHSVFSQALQCPGSANFPWRAMHLLASRHNLSKQLGECIGIFSPSRSYFYPAQQALTATFDQQHCPSPGITVQVQHSTSNIPAQRQQLQKPLEMIFSSCNQMQKRIGLAEGEIQRSLEQVPLTCRLPRTPIMTAAIHALPAGQEEAACNASSASGNSAAAWRVQPMPPTRQPMAPPHNRPSFQHLHLPTATQPSPSGHPESLCPARCQVTRHLPPAWAWGLNDVTMRQQLLTNNSGWPGLYPSLPTPGMTADNAQEGVAATTQHPVDMRHRRSTLQPSILLCPPPDASKGAHWGIQQGLTLPSTCTLHQEPAGRYRAPLQVLPTPAGSPPLVQMSGTPVTIPLQAGSPALRQTPMRSALRCVPVLVAEHQRSIAFMEQF